MKKILTVLSLSVVALAAAVATGTVTLPENIALPFVGEKPNANVEMLQAYWQTLPAEEAMSSCMVYNAPATQEIFLSGVMSSTAQVAIPREDWVTFLSSVCEA